MIKKNKIKSNFIICPKCNETIKINFKNYKISLFDCENEHSFNNISLEQFEETQKIICGQCRTNKNNELYKCFDCSIYLCQYCKSFHENTHQILNFKQLNFICKEHNEIYDKYCESCKNNICRLCKGHSKHNTKYFGDLLIEEKELKEDFEELKYIIGIFNNNINKIISIINEVQKTINKYFQIKKYFIDNYSLKYINFDILYNLKEIKDNTEIKQDLDKFNNENDYEKKFNSLLKIYNKMQISNEIRMTVKVDKEDINKNIYFLDNTNGRIIVNGREEEHFHDFLKELNQSKVDVFINGNKFKYLKCFKTDKKEIYNITLKFKKDIKDCSFMFYGCDHLINIDLSSFSTRNVINMENMFGECINLTNINLSLIDARNVVKMDRMFYNCNKLIKINLLSFETENVINTKEMFYKCKNLRKIDLSNFNTTKVTNMSKMFYKCNSLTEINLSKFNTINVEYMEGMFYKCNNLSEIDLSNFKTTNVIDMSKMFAKCWVLKNINLSSFDTQKVNDMSEMFSNCYQLSKINLSPFIIKNTTNVENIFSECENLKKIIFNKKSFNNIKEKIDFGKTNIDIVYA